MLNIIGCCLEYFLKNLFLEIRKRMSTKYKDECMILNSQLSQVGILILPMSWDIVIDTLFSDFFLQLSIPINRFTSLKS